MRAHRSPRFVTLMSALTFVLVLQFMQLMNVASGAPTHRVAQRIHAADSREVVAAGNTLKARKTLSRSAPLALTGGAVAPTISIAFLLMLDGALLIWFSRPTEQRA